MTEHSPGPWQKDGRRIHDRDGNLVARTAVVDAKYFAASTSPEMQANACLIETAPELLNQLEDFVAQWACGCGHPHCLRCSMASDARKIIEKAKP